MYASLIIVDEVILLFTYIFVEQIKFINCDHLSFDNTMAITERNKPIWKCENFFSNVNLLVLLAGHHNV